MDSSAFVPILTAWTNRPGWLMNRLTRYGYLARAFEVSANHRAPPVYIYGSKVPNPPPPFAYRVVYTMVGPDELSREWYWGLKRALDYINSALFP